MYSLSVYALLPGCVFRVLHSV